VPSQSGPDTYDVTTPVGQVRLLINDTAIETPVFHDAEISGFLALEGDVVKQAAALAVETIAGDEALTSKVIRTQDLSTDGAKLATALLAQAKAWRDQAADEADGYFELVDVNGSCYSWGPELTEHPICWP
jgi:hypothetical protein